VTNAGSSKKFSGTDARKNVKAQAKTCNVDGISLFNCYLESEWTVAVISSHQIDTSCPIQTRM